MHVLVLGASGRTGHLVLHLLLAAQHTVTGTTRSAVGAERVRATGATAVDVDLLTATSTDLAAVMQGVDAVVYAAGSGYGDPGEVVDRLDGQAIIETVNAAAVVGVQRFVLISAHRTDEDFGPPSVVRLLRAKRAADAHLRASALGWTILRPDALSEDPPRGRLTLDEQVPHGTIPRADLARLIVTALEHQLAVHRQLEVIGGSEDIRTALERTSLPRS